MDFKKLLRQLANKKDSEEIEGQQVDISMRRIQQQSHTKIIEEQKRDRVQRYIDSLFESREFSGASKPNEYQIPEKSLKQACANLAQEFSQHYGTSDTIDKRKANFDNGLALAEKILCYQNSCISEYEIIIIEESQSVVEQVKQELVDAILNERNMDQER